MQPKQPMPAVDAPTDVPAPDASDQAGAHITVNSCALADYCALLEERSWRYEAEHQARIDAEAALQTRDQISALISHDLSNQLAVIIGQVYILQQRLAPAAPNIGSIGHGLEIIKAAARQMDAQLGELQDLTQLRVGPPLTLYRTTGDLIALVHRSVATYQATSERHHIEVQTALPTLPGNFDVSRLERAIGNLLANALKYSPRGGVITVAIREVTDGDQRWADLTISDEGIGIPAADLPFIFEPFYRARNVMERGIRGTGLGLVSTRQIVELHGGTISVVSEVGKGSTFTVRLPLVEPKPDGVVTLHWPCQVAVRVPQTGHSP